MDRKVAICTPIHRYTHADFTASLIKTYRAVKDPDNLAWLNMVGNANLAQARNILVSEAIKRGVDDIVFIDSDIGWEPDAFAALFEAPQDCLIVAGAPQRRDQQDIKFCSVVDDKRATNGRLISGIAATAFMRIQARVFPMLKYAETYQHNDGETRAWFDYVRYYNQEHGISGFINEDFYFSMKSKEEGVENWIDPTIKLRHYNNIALTACMVDHI
ncbi:MAG: hypothetical protein MRY72_04355 [Aquisalinus sp.]|nr:hypothetical protein [Aquisalinus sp.]